MIAKTKVNLFAFIIGSEWPPQSAVSGCMRSDQKPDSSSGGVTAVRPRPGTSGVKIVPLSTGALGKPHRCLYLVVPLCENLFLGQECLSSNACVNGVCSLPSHSPLPSPLSLVLYQPSEGGTG